MPMNGTTYVNPGWKNGGPPALNAAELNAISDTLAAAQAKNLSQDALIAALQTSVSGKGQVEIGSYVGTGLSGQSNPNSITFSFSPKVVIVYEALVSVLKFAPNMGYPSGSFIWQPGTTSIQGYVGGTTVIENIFALSNRTLSWYTTYTGSLNSTGVGNFNYLNGKYLYFALA